MKKLLVALVALLIAASPAFAEEAKELNVFSWSEYIPQELAPCYRLPGFIGPVPPPLWINVVQLSCVIVYHEWAICQYENTQESCRFKMMLCKKVIF